MQELLEILAAMAASKGRIPDPKELILDMAERVVKSATAEFACKMDEVAILILTADGKHLRFAAPRKFADLGTIPVTKRDSIAVGVFGRKVGEVMNNVPMVKHVAFFESVKLRDRPAPIQKMVTVPIMHRGEAVGVAQISRKGDNPSQAGPDFTPADVKRAEQFFAAVAPHLAEARPENF
jgi:GAF domain